MIVMCWHYNFTASKMYLQLFVGYYTNLLFSVQLSEQNVSIFFQTTDNSITNYTSYSKSSACNTKSIQLSKSKYVILL